jgi:hypothetical protein
MIRWATVYGQLSDVKRFSRWVSKNEKLGFYLEAEEQVVTRSNILEIDEKFLRDVDVKIGSAVFRIEVFGPKLLKVKESNVGKYFILQESDGGVISRSLPMSLSQAKMSLFNSNGTKNMIVKIISEAVT